MKTLLLIVTWLQGAPVVQTQFLESPSECRIAAESVMQMITVQARTNMMPPHGNLVASRDEKTGEWRLSTGMGRELASLRCTSPNAGGR